VSEDWQASSKKESKAVFVRLCAIFFMLGMGPGFWLPGLTNIIKQAGWGNDWVALVFFIFPIASMISPLCSGAIADQKIAAQKLAAWVSVISSITMVGAFYCLDRGFHPWYFVGLFFLTTVIGAPLWNLVITIAMTHLPRPEAQFAQVRLWCTVGWILGGWIASLVMRADASPMAGYAGAVCRIILACSLLLAPDTPPRGVSSHWRSLLGFDAFRLLKDKNLRVLLIGSAVLTMPITSFYMHTPEHLRALGDMRSTFTMSFGQWSEVAAMAVTGWLMLRYRLKTLLLVGLGFSVLRFVLFSLGGEQESLLWMWPGIAIHGICYTLFFITGQIYMDQRVEPAMRGQMQGLLGLVTNGIGALLGTVGLKILHRYTVERGDDWTSYWAILTGFTIICTLWFMRAFEDKKTPPAG
jgi:MFS family permease